MPWATVVRPQFVAETARRGSGGKQVSFVHDIGMLVTSSMDSTVIIFDIDVMEKKNTFTGHRKGTGSKCTNAQSEPNRGIGLASATKNTMKAPNKHTNKQTAFNRSTPSLDPDRPRNADPNPNPCRAHVHPADEWL